MSADNYERIVKKNGKYILYMGNASSGYETKEGEFKTIEEAINESQGSEYGLTFNLEEKEESNE